MNQKKRDEDKNPVRTKRGSKLDKKNKSEYSRASKVIDVNEKASEQGKSDSGLLDNADAYAPRYISRKIKEKPSSVKSKGKVWKRRILIALLAVLSVLLVLVAGIYAYFRHIFNDPGSQFSKRSTVSVPQLGGETIKDVVNILLVGLDYNEEREKLADKHTYNTDVMIVLALDFQNQKVDMISLPRDSYANIPDAEGIYKLNAAMKCGGGFPQGFTKVMKATEWMLGGIPIDYYYGVTMPVIQELVDTIGGINYDVEMDFTVDNHSYRKGMQHMNGQAVLDYMRVRKNIEQSGDLNRINRQKRMLITLFKAMKEKNLWSNLPGFLSTVNGNISTNASLSQTAALASFAYNLKEDNIKMHSMGGTMASVFNLNFCITDQTARVALIKEVYGITVPEYADYGYEGVMKKWASMMYDVYAPNAETLINHVQGLIDTAQASHKSISNDVYTKFLAVKEKYEQVQNVKGSGQELVNALNNLKIDCLSLASKVDHPLKSTSKWVIEYKNEFDVI